MGENQAEPPPARDGDQAESDGNEPTETLQGTAVPAGSVPEADDGEGVGE